jgi:hypothetical protein
MSHGDAFHLSKWYVDCVGETGECAIAYHARLRWGPVVAGYCGLLHHRADGITRSESTIRPGPLPTAATGHVAWATPALNLSVSADSRSDPFARQLLAGTAATIDWACLAPSADVSIRRGSTLRLNGLGYAERLDIRSHSLHLPIEQLRWGRFLTATRAIVWIGWWGPEPRILVFDQGVCREDAVIGDGEIRFGPVRLALDRRAVIRDAGLADVLKPLARFRALPLAQAAGIHETKWLSRGTLHDPARPGRVEGWAIHELVHFP